MQVIIYLKFMFKQIKIKLTKLEIYKSSRLHKQSIIK